MSSLLRQVDHHLLSAQRPPAPLRTALPAPLPHGGDAQIVNAPLTVLGQLPLVGDGVLSAAEEEHFGEPLLLAVLGEDGGEDAVDPEVVGGQAAERTHPARVGGLRDHEHEVVQVETLEVLAEDAPRRHAHPLSCQDARQGNLYHF
jgi:hypothetical protein